MSRSTVFGPDSVTPPVDERTASLEIWQPDFGWLLVGLGTDAWGLIVRVKMVELGQIKAVPLARPWPSGRHLTAAIVYVSATAFSPHIFWWQRGEMFQLLLQLPLLKDLRSGLDISQCAADRGQAYLCTTATPEASVTGAMAVRCSLAVTGAQARRVPDGKLCYRPHLSGYPAG